MHQYRILPPNGYFRDAACPGHVTTLLSNYNPMTSETYTLANIKQYLEQRARHERGLFDEPFDPDTRVLVAQLEQLRDWVTTGLEDSPVKMWYVETALRPIVLQVWYADGSAVQATPAAAGVATEPLRSE